MFFRDGVRLLAVRPAVDGAPDGEVHDAIRDLLLRAGASFWPDLELVIHGGVNFTPYRPSFLRWLEGSRADTRCTVRSD